ncbi:xanthine dehydrogenase accessory factor [Altererythrobacter xiamenensis]|uniref:Xanthine dehydrogenase accessory factor n=1 Tax=Altererythrobacter xiamenensis TaxID=1316679 RepID=A0A1Y6F4K9_9SPHN|nr:XdhC family protein [Altererythrobacter xiamenensis]SMQ69449.1 xanthine dehydrogenase accessory factor [Altererythrobacter xiamenensis]
MLDKLTLPAVQDEEHQALAAACEPGVGLATIVGIEGSFSRRLGSQLAVRPDGSTVGSLSDGCLEAQIASDIASARDARVIRYGHGSSTIDFRLPCGGGLDILLQPHPDRLACRQAVRKLNARKKASLDLPFPSPLFARTYLPSLRLVAFGEGAELEMFATVARAMGLEIDTRSKQDLSLGRAARQCEIDAWTAVVLLFHDHEWEIPLLEQALASEAFYIGAQGGEKAVIARSLALTAAGIPEETSARITSPLGIIPACKSPRALALSAISEVVANYENLLVTS